MVTAEDAEILQLKLQLVARRETRAVSPSEVSSTSNTVSIPTATRETRRGCAPPINLFSGDDPGVCLDDWLPSLQHGTSCLLP